MNPWKETKVKEIPVFLFNEDREAYQPTKAIIDQEHKVYFYQIKNGIVIEEESLNASQDTWI